MRVRRSPSRRLSTVMFTDMVGSTERAVELGDASWQATLRRYHSLVRAELRRFGGREVDSAGDGFFATFEQPAQAVRCALAIHAAAKGLEIAMRSGIHTGEVEAVGPKVGGVAVHLAARICSAAEPGQVLVTNTVRDLVAGSELRFTDAGARELKGFTETWRVWVADGPPAPTPSRPPETDASASIVPRGAVIVAALIGAAVGIAVLLVVGLGSGDPAAAAAPDTVARIDVDRNEVSGSVPVDRAPLVVAAGDGVLWVGSEVGTISRVSPDGSVLTVGGVGAPTGVAVADGVAWVVEGYRGRTTRVDAAQAQVAGTLPVAGRRIAAGADAVWITDDIGDAVSRLATRGTGEPDVIELPPGSGPRGVAVDESTVWVANERSRTIGRIDVASGEVVGEPIGVGDPPNEVAIGAGAIWVTSAVADRVYRVDAARGTVAATIDVCNEPDAIVASADAVWVACRLGRVVWRLDAEGAFVAEVAMPGVPVGVALLDGNVWVALRAD